MTPVGTVGVCPGGGVAGSGVPLASILACRGLPEPPAPLPRYDIGIYHVVILLLPSLCVALARAYRVESLV